MGNDTRILPSGQNLPGGGEIKDFTTRVGDVSKFAAQYLRMSKEHQKYSPENQSIAICNYATRHGLTVIRSYADLGKSGLRLDGRPALQQLLSDIRTGDTPFKIILVFDVSRWGRFQDTDESAYYEFMCRQAGFEVRYCAEPFENDGSMLSGLVKTLKRLMAAEYSRELSAKIFAAKCNFVTHGFWMGGPPGYGLRRLLVDERGQPKTILQPGQRKGLLTDRILLVPGPDQEVRVVREIFHRFVSERMTRTQIAYELNRKGILNEFGRHWNKYTVYQILTNAKYIGDNVYNRQSGKLKQKVVKNPEGTWIRAKGVFKPLIDVKSFRAAGRIIASQSTRVSDEEALRRLRLCLAEHGRLTTTIINSSKGLPSYQVYRTKFGSLERAYELIGGRSEWVRHCKKDRRKVNAIKQDILSKCIESIERDNGHVCLCNRNGLLLIDGTFSV